MDGIASPGNTQLGGHTRQQSTAEDDGCLKDEIILTCVIDLHASQAHRGLAQIQHLQVHALQNTHGHRFADICQCWLGLFQRLLEYHLADVRPKDLDHLIEPHQPLVVRHRDPLVCEPEDLGEFLRDMTTSVRFRYVVIKISADIQSCKAALLHGCAEEEGSDQQPCCNSNPCAINHAQHGGDLLDSVAEKGHWRCTPQVSNRLADKRNP
mmetsp:Transcript_1178/g.3532  ORF Transcript_1178/g.3532 Transcript_1178/m.3532 type:complete len:210 (-) Transcript_1178:124-753(-)